MSAFFVGTDHINAMLTWCETCRSFGVPVPGGSRVTNPDDSNLTAIGKALISENCKSLAARYPSDWHEMVDTDINEYRYEPDYHFLTRPNVVVRLIKLVHCYEYQACEHDGWNESWAHDFCKWMIDHLTGQLPGYEQAPWGYDKPQNAAQVMSLSRMVK